MINCPNCGEENPPKFRLCGYCGTPLAPAAAAPQAREVRRTVTIVFSDRKGSTALGASAMRPNIEPLARHLLVVGKACAICRPSISMP
jgi:hypothetical protein